MPASIAYHPAEREWPVRVAGEHLSLCDATELLARPQRSATADDDRPDRPPDPGAAQPPFDAVVTPT